MIKIIKLMLFSILILLIGSVSSLNQSLDVDYIENLSYTYNDTLDYSSFLLKIHTNEDSHCMYDDDPGVHYDNMEFNFDLSSNLLHEKSFSGLSDGVYKYYIRCKDSGDHIGEELILNLRINAKVKAQIVFSEQDPFKAGTYEITLITSKVVSQSPSLSYSFNNLVYNDLPIIGNDKIWRGYLIIPDDLGESLVSFKFKANDLEGRLGEEITSGNVFRIDTDRPNAINNINAVGYDGRIRVEWFLYDDYDEFKVYRSESSNVDLTNFYKVVRNDYLDDTLVAKGKTYYYRVSAIDEAGNEADLSKEVYATALLQNITSKDIIDGLSIELLGKVDSLIREVDSVIGDVGEVKSNFNNKEESEKEIFSDLGLNKEIDDSVSQLNSLKRDIEKFKLQDLSKEELDKKLDSSRLRLEVITRKIPEDIILRESDSFNEEINEEEIREGMLEINNEIDESELSKSLKNTNSIIEESGLGISSSLSVIEVVYLDGTKKDFSLVKRDISAILERINDAYFLEIIPKNVIESASDIHVSNLDYEIIKEDPVIGFSSDTKQIIYNIPKKVSLGSLKEIKSVFVSLSENVKEESNIGVGVTGYFSLVEGSYQIYGIVLGIIIVVLLVGYFLYLKFKRNKPEDTNILNHIKIANKLIKEGEFEEVKGYYKKIQKDYKKLKKSEKKEIFSEVDIIRNKLLINEFVSGLDILEKTKDVKQFHKLNKIYNHLSEDYRSEISFFYEKIKEKFEGGKYE